MTRAEGKIAPLLERRQPPYVCPGAHGHHTQSRLLRAFSLFSPAMFKVQDCWRANVQSQSELLHGLAAPADAMSILRQLTGSGEEAVCAEACSAAAEVPDCQEAPAAAPPSPDSARPGASAASAAPEAVPPKGGERAEASCASAAAGAAPSCSPPAGAAAALGPPTPALEDVGVAAGTEAAEVGSNEGLSGSGPLIDYLCNADSLEGLTGSACAAAAWPSGKGRTAPFQAFHAPRCWLLVPHGERWAS